MSSQEVVDKLRIMAESPTYAMRRGVLLVAAQNLEVIEAEILALKREQTSLQSKIQALEAENKDLKTEADIAHKKDLHWGKINKAALADNEKLKKWLNEFRDNAEQLENKLSLLMGELVGKGRKVDDLQSQLDKANKKLKDNWIEHNRIFEEKQKLRWIPAIKPPENLRDKPTEAAWKTHYYTLDYEDVVPKVMTAEQIFLNESSEVEYYMPIILPESEGKDKTPRRYLRTCPKCKRHDYMAVMDKVCEKCQAESEVKE